MNNRLVESQIVELKERLNDKLEKEVVSFLNSRSGGNIYIGISDDGSIVGIDDADNIQKEITVRLRDNICPNVLGLVDVILEEIENKKIIKIIVAVGQEKPYYVKSKGMSSSGCFVRVGSTSQPIDQMTIEKMFRNRNPRSIRLIQSPRQDLTFSTLKIYYQEAGLELNDNFKQSLEFYTDEGKYNYLAYLLADENGVSIKVAKYDGLDKCDLIETEEYGYCCLLKSCDRVLEKLKIENRTFAKITDTKRIEKSLIDPIALREVVINAIVHNDYTTEYFPVFEIFSDRWEITSYGGLVYGQTDEDFFNVRSMPRSRELMRVFRDMDFVEQLGSGMSRIMRVYDKDNFILKSNYLTAKFNLESREKSREKSRENLGKNAIKIISFLKDNPYATQEDLIILTSLTRQGVEKNIAKLKLLGKLKRVGPDNGGYWQVIEND